MNAHVPVISAKGLPEASCQWIVDVRTADECQYEAIPGAINIPLDRVEQLNDTDRHMLSQLPQIILSCRSGARAARAAQMLQQQSFENIKLLEGGIQGWKQAGRPVLTQKKGFSVMQQVQIIVGLMVLSGVFIPEVWFLAPIAGAGMLFAGLSNTCMMAVVLSKMPWNQSGCAASAPVTQCQR